VLVAHRLSQLCGEVFPGQADGVDFFACRLVEAVAQLVPGKIVSPLSGVNRPRKWHSGPTWDPILAPDWGLTHTARSYATASTSQNSQKSMPSAWPGKTPKALPPKTAKAEPFIHKDENRSCLRRTDGV
jgi:hypothetical protein